VNSVEFVGFTWDISSEEAAISSKLQSGCSLLKRQNQIAGTTYFHIHNTMMGI
jgi:hypothetical protein